MQNFWSDLNISYVKYDMKGVLECLVAEVWIHSLAPTDRDRQSHDPSQAIKDRVLDPLQTVADE